jgi:hypothetical protein
LKLQRWNWETVLSIRFQVVGGRDLGDSFLELSVGSPQAIRSTDGVGHVALLSLGGFPPARAPVLQKRKPPRQHQGRGVNQTCSD